MVDLNLLLDLDDPDAEGFLGGIQGKHPEGPRPGLYGPFTAHLMLKMTGQPKAVQEFIGSFAREWVVSAAEARAQKGRNETFAMVLLSADGYRYLSFADEDLPEPVDPFGPEGAGEYFKRGMKQQSTLTRSYNDPPVSEWEPGFRDTIHCMLLLADDDRPRLEDSVAEISKALDGVFEILTIEGGDKLTFAFPRGELTIEHFGFQDGVSQPIMIKQDLEKEAAKRGNAHWDPSAPLSLALVKEPGENERYGSFMVFRKLEQNVKAFWAALGQLSNDFGIDLELAGAMATGRYRDGTPLVPTQTRDPADPEIDPNDFHFDQDPDGAVCPFHAHIRKTNPRGDIKRIINPPEADAFERARRIVRRGITYGKRSDLKAGGGHERPERRVGLLFMCFQSTLDQFVIQQEGSDSNDFVQPGIGVDAVIGQNAAPVDQTWPSTGDAKFTMANFVKMLGGEHFFAPSMAFLCEL